MQLYNLIKDLPEFKESKTDYVVKQASIKQAINAWSCWIKALKSYYRDPSKFLSKPLMPKYLKNNKLNLITINKTRLRKKDCKENEIKFPNSTYKFKTRITRQNIQCVRLRKFYDKFEIEIIYFTETKDYQLNKQNFIGIDIGLNNLASITSNNQPLSVIINGRPLKSINQFYNKKKAYLQSLLPKDQFTSKKIEKLCKKRNNKVQNYIHWASKQIIDLCLGNNIGSIIIGKNDSWKQESNMGKRNNQNFTQVPFARFIEQIKYKALDNGIDIFITEESYTSKIDHLAFEEMCYHIQYKGKRVKRGLFKSSTGKKLNADCNGAIGIMRKLQVISDDQILALRNRGDVVSPIVINKIEQPL